MRAVVAPLLLVVTAALAGCPSADACVANDECAADERCVDGACAADDVAEPEPAPLVDGGDAPLVDGGDAPLVDGGGAEPDPTPSPEPLGCASDGDEALTARELPLALEVTARFVARADEDDPVGVDLVGQVADDGVTEWSLAAPLAGDHDVELTAVPLVDQWFADEFDDATYAAALDAAAANWGAFSRDDEGIWLHGVASADEGTSLLHHDPPILAVPFPVALHDEWTVETDTAGTFEGNPFYSSWDTYESVVDEAGRLETPAGVYDVLRLRTVQTVEVPIAIFPFLLTYRTVSYTFLTACLGQVGVIASVEGEEELVFQAAASVRRAGWSQ